MVHVATKRIAILAASLCFITFLYSPISDFDLNNIPESLAMLKRIQARIDAVARTRGLTTIDVHDRACLTLFGIGEADVRVQETIQRTFDEVKSKLNPLKQSRHPASLQRATEELLYITKKAKKILDARFAHLFTPAKYPAVEYPEKIISLQSVIGALYSHQEATRPLISSYPRAAAIAAAHALSVPRLDFRKLATPDRLTQLYHSAEASRAIAERQLTPYYVDARASTACAGAGDPAHTSSKTKLPSRKLKLDEEREYKVFDLYLVIHGEDKSSQDFLLIQTNDDGYKNVYYPAMRGDAPATPEDFKHYSDEIEFVELNQRQLVQILTMYIREGITVSMLRELSNSPHFPFFDDVINAALREIYSKGSIGRTNFTNIIPHEPTPAETRPKSSCATIPRRCSTMPISFCPGACTMRLKTRIFYK